MHGNGLADDETIADQFSDCLSGVCIGDFVDLVGIEPNLAFAAANNGRRTALLGSEVHPGEGGTSASNSFRGLGNELIIFHGSLNSGHWGVEK